MHKTEHTNLTFSSNYFPVNSSTPAKDTNLIVHIISFSNLPTKTLPSYCDCYIWTEWSNFMPGYYLSHDAGSMTIL